MRLFHQIGYTSVDNVDTKYLVGHRVRHFISSAILPPIYNGNYAFTLVNSHPKYNKPGGICQ